MRISIKNDQAILIPFLFMYIEEWSQNKPVVLKINGEETTGTIKQVHLEKEDVYWILLTLDTGEKKFPLSEESKIDLGKDIFYFETKSHTTVIEF